MNLKDTIDAWLSNDDKIKMQAKVFLCDQIINNPTFYISLIEFYSSTDAPDYRRSTLISLTKIITNNFRFVQQVLQEFCGKITNLIQNSPNVYEQKALSGIIFQIALKLEEIFNQKELLEYFNEYLVLYQTQNSTIPFCVNLHFMLMMHKNFYLRYRESFEKITSEIIFSGLQYDDIEIKLYSIDIFNKISQNVDDNFIDMYQDHISIINQISENSLEINEVNEDNFYKIWLHLFKVDNKISVPLFETAHSILHSENLSPKNRNILLEFIIVRNELINVDFIEDLITSYFITQCEIEEIDDKFSIFSHLIKVDEKRSYELFKREFLSYLKDDDLKKQYVGLSLLPNFFLTYQKETVNDISTILQIAIDAASKSEDNLRKGFEFFEYFLSENDFNLIDSILIFDFLINFIVKYTDDNIQYKVLNICKNLTVNPLFFENMISIFENIEPESYAVYFSILIYLYKIESPISLDKYQPFWAKLIEIFNECNQKVAEGNDTLQEDPENSEIKKELYNYTLIQGSASNLIFYLRFFSPTQFEESFNLAIKNILNIIEDENELSDFCSEFDFFDLSDVKEDFTKILHFIKGPAIEIIQDHIDIIVDGANIDQLQHFLCTYIDQKNDCASDFIDYFNEESDLIFGGTRADKGQIISTLREVVYPISKWIYKITDDPELHEKFLKFINALIHPKFITCDVYNLISEILLRTVKPKRVEFNSQNQSYEGVVKAAQFIAIKMVEIIPKIEPASFNLCFDGFSNLELLFAYTKNDNGHKFLSEFLIPFYKENKETTETKMLDLFSKLIKFEYCNDEEIEKTVEIIIEIIKRGKIYQDIETFLFDLMTNLIKIHPKFSPLFIDFSIEIFNENKNDEIQIDLKAFCAHFLLSAFNRNPEEFEEKIMPLISEIFSVFPISTKHKTVQFWFEIKSFIETFKDKMTEEICESLIRCLTRYLSYQKFANNIFSVPDEQHGEIIQFYGEIIGAYLSEHPDITLKNILDNFLPHQPTSVEFILSLYSKK